MSVLLSRPLLTRTVLCGLPILGMAIAWFFPVTLWSIILLALLTALSIIDLKTEMIPDWLSGLLIVTGLLQSGFARPALLGALLCVGLGLISAIITRDKGLVGSADYFLIAALVAWLGPSAAYDALIIALIILALQLIITRQRFAAFAPAISVGMACIWFGGLTA